MKTCGDPGAERLVLPDPVITSPEHHLDHRNLRNKAAAIMGDGDGAALAVAMGATVPWV
jgi:hypothetical protein